MRVGVGDIQISDEEKALVNEVLNSNRLSYGKMTRRLEQRFAGSHDVKHAIFCNSGTSALHIAVAALKERYGWQDGDEVLVPATTFVATANVVLHNNLVPRFVDVHPSTYNIDVTKIEVTPNTKAIIPVHLMGLPCDMDEVLNTGLKVIEDSCECMFARYRGRPVGSMGDIGCFSTYAAHYMVTGVGGFCTTNDDELNLMLRSLMNHGRDPAYLSIDDTGTAPDRRFKFIRPGHSFRATELEAALGLGQIENRFATVFNRRANAAYLTEHLLDLSAYLQLPTTAADRDHVFMLYPLVMRRERKERMIQHLEDAGIETRDLMPLVNQPIYCDQMHGKYPVAEWLCDRGFYIGCHQYLSQEQLEYTVKTIHDYF